MLPRQPHQSLIDGLACFQAVIGSTKPVGVRDLSEQLGFEVTRVHRMLKTLSHLGFVQQNPDRKYTHGPAVHILSAQTMVASGLTRNAIKFLPKLKDLNVITAMGILWQDQVGYLYRANRGQDATDAIGRVGLYPASDSSIGLVLLSKMSDSEIKQLYKGKPIPGHKDKIESLLKEVQKVREDGYASRATNEKGHTSIGVGISDPPVAAIAVAGIIPPANKKTIISRLQEVATQIAESMEAGQQSDITPGT